MICIESVNIYDMVNGHHNNIVMAYFMNILQIYKQITYITPYKHIRWVYSVYTCVNTVVV